MGTNRFYTATSLFLVFLLGYLTYMILSPFLNAIAWAIVFSIVFFPVYVFLERYLRFRTVASVVTLLLIMIIILGPFTYLSFIFVDEIKSFMADFNKGSLDSVKAILSGSGIARLIGKFQTAVGIEGVDFAGALAENVRKFGTEIAGRLSAGIANIAGVAIDFVFMLFAVFFFLKDGPEFLSRIMDYLPFSAEDKKRLMSKVKDMVISTVYGGVIVAIIQGIIGGVTFYFLGIQSPVLWGASISVMSFLPLLGTFSVWGPVAGYLFIQGSYMKGIILLLVGFFGISMVDNVLKPLIISGRTKMPTLAVFFSVLGGIHFLGFIGFILGPLVLALFVSVLEIFRHIEGGEHA